MIVSSGDILIFFKAPISLTILVLSLVFTILILRMNGQPDRGDA